MYNPIWGKKTLVSSVSRFSITGRLVAPNKICCVYSSPHSCRLFLFHTRNVFTFFLFQVFVYVYVCVCVWVFFFFKSHTTLASPSEDSMHFKVLCVKFKVFPAIWDGCFGHYFSSNRLMGTPH